MPAPAAGAMRCFARRPFAHARAQQNKEKQHMKEQRYGQGFTTRLRAVLGSPDGGDDVVHAAFETTADGFVVVAPAPVREALEPILDAFAAELSAGGAFTARWIEDGYAEIVGSGLDGMFPLARVDLAQRVADSVSNAAIAEGGVR